MVHGVGDAGVDVRQKMGGALDVGRIVNIKKEEEGRGNN